MTYCPPQPQAVIDSFLESYGRKVRARRRRHMQRNFKLPPTDRAGRVFREMLLEHVSRYTPRQSSEIKRRLEDDYGSVGYRRVWRHLRILVRDGAVVRTPDGYLRARRSA